ncbi:uncharacterized protein LOC106174247 [Lingula anatina]|uniref:Uncharacterized protein LOC106174246 n=1 Tax=Lingula anatina TaxID=7574 RepID=A0A1S3JL71_LINAN|nr:uncharacterized protein LOC106174246 [Lingula anatina]XP_013411155.1 uncharacterized protein LOC106174247 [Lingula anatina]|eukprot:XP_013411154.1 uncharacterized protein LOC106174246 [Lingula anatina]
MAASGINEHNEARRRERFLFRNAYFQKQSEEAAAAQRVQNHFQQGGYAGRPMSSYEQQLQATQRQSSPVKHTRESEDMRRRKEHSRMMAQEYSAKIPFRYSSTDYISQW